MEEKKKILCLRSTLVTLVESVARSEYIDNDNLSKWSNCGGNDLGFEHLLWRGKWGRGKRGVYNADTGHSRNGTVTRRWAAAIPGDLELDPFVPEIIMCQKVQFKFENGVFSERSKNSWLIISKRPDL